jgi:O-antigen ligase
MTRRKPKTERSIVPPLPISRAERIRPWLLMAMTALFVARPMFPSESAATYGDGLSMVMLWILLAVFWLLGNWGRRTFSVRFGWLDAAVLALIGWCSVAAIVAVGRGTPRPAINMLWEWQGMGLCFLVARQLMTSARDVRAVAAVMIGLSVALSGFGLYQYGYELPQTRAEYRADPDRAMRQAGLWFPPGSPERHLFESRMENKEPIATFALTNSLGAFLTPWLIVLAGIGVATVQSRKPWIPVAMCAAPVLICLALTKSRSAYIASVVGLLIVGLAARVAMRRKRVIFWGVGALAAWVIWTTWLGRGGRGLLEKATKSFGYRVQYWQSSLQMIADHPIVGCGPGNFQNAYLQYKLPEAAEEVADPHNFMLEIAATAGIPAALAFLVVLGCFGGVMVRGFEISDWRFQNSNPESRIPDPTFYIFSGGIVGFFLAVPIGMLSAAPQSMAVVFLGLPLMAGTLFLLRGWVAEGTLPRWLIGAAVLVLLIDLLTTGGIAYPSVAESFWLLMALGLQDVGQRSWRPMVGWVLGAALMVMAAACYVTAYRPVLRSMGEVHLAQREPDRAAEHLEAAAAADPWAAEPWRQLAAVEFERWREQPNAETFGRFEKILERLTALAPNSATDRLAAGDFFMFASRQMEGVEPKLAKSYLDRARTAYEAAVRLYPNNAAIRVKLAEADEAAGDRAGLRREAGEALRLDGLTPHSDKKLPEDVRNRLMGQLERDR